MDIVIKQLSTIEPYQGEHQIPGIRFRPVRQALGVSAWGMNVLELAAGCEGYPEHDHVNVMKDGQEEVYLVLDGSVVLLAEGSEHVLRRGDLVKVPPHVTRKFMTRAEPATLLALGGTPGKAYAP
jgi:uncharacterized cupin superfamily protein